MSNKTDIMVTVCIVTYNQEQWIRQTIESVLAQQTNFSYEVIIGEDCSTDNTFNICNKYQKIYPNLVQVIHNNPNLGLMRNLQKVLSSAKGRYIALCAGDDYWCDINKLQKQVDYLASHPDYGVVFTAGYTLTDGKLIPHAPAMGAYHNGDMSKESIEYTVGYASSVMYRSNLLKYIDIEEYLQNGIFFEDYIMYAIFSMHTYFAFIEDKTMVYRIIKKSLSHSLFNIGYAESWANTRRYLQHKYPERCHYNLAEVDDSVNYTKLKRAIFDGCYLDATNARNAIKSSKYKSKIYTKWLKGRISFRLLHIQMRLRTSLSL